MAIVHEVPEKRSWLARMLTTDFCPWANRFVYWLKEPIGWFVVATAVSCIIGLYFSPVGWSLAASLTAIMCAGILWPLVAIHAVRLDLAPGTEKVHEDAPCRMVVSARNRLPIPVWGLAVEGYLQSDCQLDNADAAEALSAPLPTVGLASVPAISEAEYSIDVHPTLRGVYPKQTPSVACSFPFGIWTARRKIDSVSSLMVWPRIFSSPGLARFSDRVAADLGIGKRGGRDGDMNGVREYRRGDLAKHVHWVASARMNALMITERSAPESAAIDIRLDTRIGSLGSEELSRRIRIAASIAESLHKQEIPLRVHLNHCVIRVDSHRLTVGKAAFRKTLDHMACIALEGTTGSEFRSKTSVASIEIVGDELGTVVNVCNPAAARRLGNGVREWRVDAIQDLAIAMQEFWTEVGHGKTAA